MTELSFSLIIPVYNRPDEVSELLQSLTEQSVNKFEIIIVEDGSEKKSDKIVEQYNNKLNIQYFYKPNSGPGTSRNYGAKRASGNYFIFLDSDCIIPEKYIEIVLENLNKNYTDAFGGPDNAHKSFTKLQKAINYSMTSFLTTGGIRGKSEKVDKFYPRSFNMGYSKQVFETTGGFSEMRFGEDIDMSIRIINAGYKTQLLKDAFVYHKRRTKLKQFFKQIFNSGIARINLYIKYPESLKLVHLFPLVFLLSVLGLIIMSVSFSFFFVSPICLHSLIIFSDSSVKNRNISIGFLSVITTYAQYIAYGIGFLKAFIMRVLLKKKAFDAFNNNFYR
jgi:glycosyltransferase involved in cell wall biosynthesis